MRLRSSAISYMVLRCYESSLLLYIYCRIISYDKGKVVVWVPKLDWTVDCQLLKCDFQREYFLLLHRASGTGAITAINIVFEVWSCLSLELCFSKKSFLHGRVFADLPYTDINWISLLCCTLIVGPFLWQFFTSDRSLGFAQYHSIPVCLVLLLFVVDLQVPCLW